MKIWFQALPPVGGRDRARGSLAALALLAALLVLPSFGHTDRTGTEGPPGPGPQNPGAASLGGGDETLGTLPTLGVGPALDLRRVRRIEGPAMYVEGPADSVLTAALGARGDRRAEVVALPGGRARLVFPGSLEVAFDRDSLELGGFEFGIVGAEGLVGLRSGAAWNGRALQGWTPAQQLPVGLLSTGAWLDEAPLVAVVAGGNGSVALRFRAVGGVVVVSQRR
jgi:hypothetical protein